MPAATIDRLQTPLRQEFLKKLSANFRPVGKVGQTTHGQAAFRSAALQRAGIILIEANLKSEANHTMEISLETGCSWASTGGTPASGADIADGKAWIEVDYATAGTKTVTATETTPVGIGTREVVVP